MLEPPPVAHVRARDDAVKPDTGNPSVRFEEGGGGRLACPSATLLSLCSIVFVTVLFAPQSHVFPAKSPLPRNRLATSVTTGISGPPSDRKGICSPAIVLSKIPSVGPPGGGVGPVVEHAADDQELATDQ
jgi:hypothetical protein